MVKRTRARGLQQGFTYMGVMVLIVVAGIALESAGRYWRTVSQREKEAELLFRGDQIRQAIASYYQSAPHGNYAYPRNIKALLKDPRYPGIRRHLRKIYPDPMQRDGRWEVIQDQSGGIKGVYSRSTGVPLKTGAFPEKYAAFEKATRYSDWKFIFNPAKKSKIN